VPGTRLVITIYAVLQTLCTGGRPLLVGAGGGQPSAHYMCSGTGDVSTRGREPVQHSVGPIEPLFHRIPVLEADRLQAP
jgi:hypothetical protein